MRGTTAKRLRRLSVEQAQFKQSEKEQKLYPHKVQRKDGEKLVEYIINYVTQRYKKDSPMFLYRSLKRQWKALPWYRRKVENLVVVGK